VIAGIYRTPTAQGLTMTREVFEAAGYVFSPSAVVTAARLNAVPNGVGRVVHTSDLAEGWDDMVESMMLMVYILIVAAVLLAAVVLYNLGVLSFTEMSRALATLRVIGFKSSKLRNVMLVQNLILTLIGFLFGIPSGILLVKAMLASMGDSFDMIAALHFTDVLFSALIMFGVAIGINLLFGIKLKRVDMVSALKSAE
jgi:putative ABC transport system permease protein